MRWLIWLPWLAVACRSDGAVHDPPGPSGDPTVVDPTGSDPMGTGAGGPTWYQDVAPVAAEHCGGCHVAGGVAPFSVETYEDAQPWGEAMASAVESGSMPPFFAVDDALCDSPDLLDDLRLSDEQKALFTDWVAAGKPAGDPATAAPAPLHPVRDLVDYDSELQIDSPFAVSGSDDIYQCFRVPMPTSEDVWITGVQVVPDNELVVHHVLVWYDPNDNSAGQVDADGSYRCSGFPDLFPTELVAAWAPGGQPTLTPENTGTLVHPGSSLVLNIHYHPTGTSTEVDQTRLRLQWTTTQPANYAMVYLVDMPFGAIVQPGPEDQGGAEFRIPAGAADHLETEEMWFPDLVFPDMPVYAVAPHMHFLGTDMLVTLDHQDEPDQCLVHTPGFRFDWQQGYAFDPDEAPLPVIHGGDRLRVQCRYDNSASNPFMPLHLDASGASAPHDVYWGEETGDEMCMAMVGLVLPPVDWLELFGWL